MPLRQFLLPIRLLRSRGARVGFGLIGLGLALVLALEVRSLRVQAAGARIFAGQTPVIARIAGQDWRLPMQAAACTNCHTPVARGTLPAVGAAAAVSWGPLLSAASLTQRHARRGGPPSHFDEAAFCRLLRTGEDPVGVLLDQSMPRYDVDAAMCHQLWMYLMHRSP